MRRAIVLQVFVFLFLIPSWITAQQFPFDLTLNPVEVEGFPGVQSFAFGQHEGKWLLVGGRVDGLHRRQPWAAFDEAGRNGQLMVVDPVAGTSWTSNLDGLSEEITLQLSSTNMEFIQEGETLYCLGGYGYSTLEQDHTTFDMLTAIHLPTVIDAVVEGQELSEGFRSVSDAAFEVTGGKLLKIGEVFHLLGGQKFEGRYNPMGPDFGPGFFQEYTDAVRRFTLEDNGETIAITHLEPFEDSEHLHRRDYNALPQIMPDGSEGITLFSGVFQPETDLPFLYPVDVSADDYTPQESFLQYFNHYHCASVSLTSLVNANSFNLFFGGMARYYYDDGLVEDDNVPFVKSIASVSRDASGLLAEELLGVEMPGLLGAGSEFIPNPDIAVLSNGVMNMDQWPEGEFILGYVCGGIESTSENIFFTNDGTQSSAHQTIYEVRISPSTGMGELSDGVRHGEMQLNVFPNPAHGKLKVRVTLGAADDVSLTLHDSQGKAVLEKKVENLSAGKHTLLLDLPATCKGSYVLRLDGRFQVVSHKVIVE